MAGRALIFAGVTALMAGPAMAQSLPETDCDRLAGLWLLPRVDGMAQVYRITDPDAAVGACEAARATDPDDPFFAVLLARALIAARPDDARALGLMGVIEAMLPALSAWQIGTYYEAGLAGLPASERSARDFYRSACDYWPEPMARPGCAAMAVMMIEGRGGPDDATDGFAILGNLCHAGWAMACTDMALQRELRGGATEPQIAEMLQMACDVGDYLGCSLLGFRYETEQGASYDMTRARDLYERACEGGEGHGCANMAEVYRSGTGVAPDVARAVTLFTRACDSDDSFACLSLGDILADGRGVPTDVAAAVVAYDHACWLGDPEACDRADMLR